MREQEELSAINVGCVPRFNAFALTTQHLQTSHRVFLTHQSSIKNDGFSLSKTSSHCAHGSLPARATSAKVGYGESSAVIAPAERVVRLLREVERE